MDADSFERVEVTSEDALWAWLEARHSLSRSVWLVTWKAARRDKYLSREQVLDALVAYGWTDGRRMKLDDDRTMQLISPRKQHAWAQSYKSRAARLESEGRMKAPGRARIAEAKASGLWNATVDVDACEEPDDLHAALDASGGAAWWASAAPSYRRNILRWIAGAKRDETRRRRIDDVAVRAARGDKVPNY